MANITRIRLPGFWVVGSVVDAEEFEAIDAARPKQINASEGSTHAPSDPIIIGGDGIQITGPAHLQDARTIVVTNGGDITLSGGTTMTVEPGAEINSEGDYNVKDGGAITAESGSAVTVKDGADFIIEGATNWPQLSSRTTTRTKWGLAWCNFASTPPADPCAWFEVRSVNEGRVLRTSTETVARVLLLELFELPPGALIATIDLLTIGFGGTDNLPQYTPVKWKDAAADVPLGTTTADAHSVGNWATTNVTTTLTCNPVNSVVDPDFHYGILVAAPWDAGTPSRLTIIEVRAHLTLTSIQS